MIAAHRKQPPRRERLRTGASSQALQEEVEGRAAIFAWLQNFRRSVVRYEYKDENFLGMAQLGCIVILLRKCL
jgi:transposase